MTLWQRKISPSVLLITLLAILLGVLATLQYHWLTEISARERERLEARLQTDARRFSQDFNGEITRLFYTFQVDSQVLQPEDFKILAERYDLWNSQTKFPHLVETVFLISDDGNGKDILRRLNLNAKQFENANWTDDIAALREKLREFKIETDSDELAPVKLFSQAIDEDIPAVIIPVLEPRAEKMLVNASAKQMKKGTYIFNVSTKPDGKPHQFIIVKLSAQTITNEMLPEIIRRNFAEEGSNYNFRVVNRAKPEKIIFQSTQNDAHQKQFVEKPDAVTGILEISPDSANVLILGSGLPRVRVAEKRTMIFHQSIKRRTVDVEAGNQQQIIENNLVSAPNSNNVQVSILSSKSENSAQEAGNIGADGGRWILSIQHTDGSLENFVGKTKWRNLGLSFGILALLGSSVVLLVFSTHKLRRTAQRQIDFVSSVSHEFRTPVAVICSAGDNLADGIVTNPANIEKYGRLIRREGNRLTEMVEQILEFAGARSGRKRYSFQPAEIAPLIAAALSDCQSLLDEKGFQVETNIAPDLPKIVADAKALRLVLQNLINNSAKYSNGTRWLEISAAQTGAKIILSVTDKGIGIEPREIKQIFEPFYRGKSVVDAQIHGNGLGLSLVKQIVEAHKGQITVESQPRKGCKFTIQLPIGIE
ncbi:MAG: HAMP domain-containing sensor histidine kinase [Pyrinomonadaceae bacterium]